MSREKNYDCITNDRAATCPQGKRSQPIRMSIAETSTMTSYPLHIHSLSAHSTLGYHGKMSSLLYAPFVRIHSFYNLTALIFIKLLILPVTCHSFFTSLSSSNYFLLLAPRSSSSRTSLAIELSFFLHL